MTNHPPAYHRNALKFCKMVKAFNQFIGKTFRFKNIDLWGLNKSQELGALKFQVKESLVLY